MMEIPFSTYIDAIAAARNFTHCGTVTDIIGLLIESSGPKARMGEICRLWPRSGSPVLAEIVGFRGGKALLMPFDDLDGIAPGSLVEATGTQMKVPVGKKMLGRITNALGFPMDKDVIWPVETYYPVMEKAPAPLERGLIHSPLSTGIRAIDGLLTIGEGQRIGIFSGSGVGKSTLMGMIARNTSGDVNVIALIGERGREVREFIEKDLGKEGLRRSVVVVATSDEPALMRIKSAWVATAIAEYFRDQGLNVLLMMDSITRWCMAQREVGLAIGEPPTTRGYTPSVFSNLPKLLERAGKASTGSITGIYTVLVEGDDMDEPIADAARGILDGHIVLSRDLAQMGHYPSIDVLGSVSRLMPTIVSKEHLAIAQEMRSILATYKKAEDLVNIGAYVQGSNPAIDRSLEHIEAINAFLKQGVDESVSFDDVVAEMTGAFKNIG
ncbi:MAG: flagellar protein export ATPase FliI [Firmicutes bacterium]|jgi:flagellum-specific ATP synthase|nr:flagellar protein export ATPase FliI [Candidatus Fermentithermobacillaceae bacterium]HON86971.1 flagellar protein export ATPase FliI [Bacillota bacterium]HRC53215.1 flagellar protein export ATPase FliI [Bacillota bacterium]